jgi:5-methyltetrahydropteroyltriglutamate--homocysteine methyltransferase
MERSTPPYRADHVGSLVRTAELIEARRGYMNGRISQDRLRQAEDQAIREVVAMQERVGLHSITDGEFRRESYLAEFLNSIGVELQQKASSDLVYQDDQGNKEMGNKTVISSQVRWRSSPNLEAFGFLKSVTKRTPKVTIPAPTQIHLFAGTDGISKEAYPDIEDFWNDIVAAYLSELRALAGAGCTYVQLDETCLPKLADPAIQEVVTRRGHDWRVLVNRYAEVINRILDGKPDSIHLVIHHCRGNRGSFWQGQAGYDAVAEVMFSQIHANAYLLEYDSPRAGDFTPLRFMPKNKIAVLGLISTKSARLESIDELKRRVDEATKYVSLDRLCLCPQCGFSSAFASSPLTVYEQRNKLERLVEVAHEVWNT